MPIDALLVAVQPRRTGKSEGSIIEEQKYVAANANARGLRTLAAAAGFATAAAAISWLGRRGTRKTGPVAKKWKSAP
jgi:hypothetical protein